MIYLKISKKTLNTYMDNKYLLNYRLDRHTILKEKFIFKIDMWYNLQDLIFIKSLTENNYKAPFVVENEEYILKAKPKETIQHKSVLRFEDMEYFYGFEGLARL
jgi:hypothetical protein